MRIETNYSIINKYNYNQKIVKRPTFRAIPDPILTAGAVSIISVLAAGYVKILETLNIGAERMDDIKNFEKLRSALETKAEPLEHKAKILDWDFYTDSTQENMQKMQEAWDKCSALYKNHKTFEKFKLIDSSKLNKHDSKQLKDILRIFDDELFTGDLKKSLRDKESEIAQKYNSYVPTLDGKEISKADITQLLQTEKNPQIRENVLEAKIKGGDLIADDLIDFVKMRNEFAKTKGYDNFFEYNLKEIYDVDANYLEKLIDEVYTRAKDKIKLIQDKNQSELKEFFKVDELKPYHYGLILDSNPTKVVNDILEKLSKENSYIIEELSKKTYEGMGYDIEELKQEGKLTLDLYPRKNKNTHGFCFGIDSGKDARILANLKNNAYALDTLNHEMGHCIHHLGVSTELPYFDRADVPSALTEAIAMMMGDIIKRENVLKDILPEDKLKKFKSSFSKDEANFVAKSLLIIDFERNLYKNPEQDPKVLWRDLSKKYLNTDSGLTNEWATIPHYLSHPAYYQNYFRATIMKAQIYNHLREKLGNITENKESAKYLTDNIFKYGCSLDEHDLIKQLTGKELSAEDFVKNL